MIFLNNVYITNERNPFGHGGFAYDRGNLESHDKLDIYMYSLASLAKAYPWKKAIIYYKLHEEYHDREQELIDFIRKEFEGTDLVLRGTRNEYVSDWIDTYELLDDELIWFCCNHDHIYLDNTDYLLNYIKMFRENFSNTLSSIYFSHWPELLCLADNVDGNPEHVDGMDILKFSSNNVDSIQIITKKLYKHWWVDGWEDQDTKTIFLPRSDHVRLIWQFKELENFNIFVPAKEICRHFDGYGHTTPKISNENCPPLSIPHGFFKNNIKINFSKITDPNNREKGYTYLDPLNDHFYASFPTGTDYKWTKQDIPHFWLDRIESYTGNESPCHEEVVDAKIKNLINLIFAYAQFRPEQFNKIKQNYLDTILKIHGYNRKLDE